MYDFLLYQTSDVMTREPVTINADLTLLEAEAIFEEHDFNGLPVVDGERLVGMITKLNMLRAFAFTEKIKVPHYQMIMKQPVNMYMTTQPETVPSDLPLTRVLQRMIETRYKSLPVVDDGRLVGIIAREDVLHGLRRAAEGIQPERKA